MKDNNNIKEINKSTDLIVSLIHEFLYKKKYEKTIDIFQNEISEKINQNEFYSFPKNILDDNNLLFQYFDMGKKNEFMTEWRRIIPNSIKLKEPVLSKLEFNLQIYFALYPILKDPKCDITNPKIKNLITANLGEFTLYLEQNKDKQIIDKDMYIYYGLPFVPDPRKNSMFEHLFKPEWINCLKEQINKCIEYHLLSKNNKFPLLYEYIKGKKIIKVENNNNNNKENNMDKDKDKKISELIVDNKHLKDENSRLRMKEDNNKKIYLDSQKTWCSLALDIICNSFDLIDIYNKSTNCKYNNNIEQINNKLTKYHNFLSKNYEDLGKEFNLKDEPKIDSNSTEKKEDLTNTNNKDNNNILMESQNMTKFPNLNNSDYKSEYSNQIFDNNMAISINTLNNNFKSNLNECLNSSSDKKPYNFATNTKNDYKNNLINITLIKSALNHNIYMEDTKLAHVLREIRKRIDQKEKLRELTLYGIFYYDLFNIYIDNDNDIIKILLSNKNLILETIKLINSLANFNIGRNYLLSKDNIVEEIVKIMMGEKGDTELRQNCLGIIQKFTLRKEPQDKIIELNIVHFLVDIFSYELNLSQYTIEYGLALLMNISMNKKGKEKFEAVYEKFIKIVLNFLNCENIQILTCINGMLYSLCRLRRIKEEAKLRGVEEKLVQLKKSNNTQLDKQVKYIMDELNNNNENDDEDNNDDYVGEDINEKDNFETIYNEYPDSELDEQEKQWHEKLISEFIISDINMNNVESNKISNFINKGLNMTKESVLNSTDNKRENNHMDSDFNNDNFNIIRTYDVLKTDENITNFISQRKNEDEIAAFKTKDKINRTPPKNLSKIIYI